MKWYCYYCEEIVLLVLIQNIRVAVAQQIYNT